MGKAVSIASVGPTVIQYKINSHIMYSGSEMLIITANSETIDGRLHSQIDGFQNLKGKLVNLTGRYRM
jgi:hypothetical protein